MAVCVPFCCCNFHAWLDACSTCEAGGGERLANSGGCREGAVDGACHHAQRGGGKSDRQPCGDRDPEPCGSHHGHECTCAQHEAKFVGGKTPLLALPAPVLLAILDRFEPRSTAMPIGSARPCLWGERAVRPTSSLLQLHCALIV